jgi:hypothetical protein
MSLLQLGDRIAEEAANSHFRTFQRAKAGLAAHLSTIGFKKFQSNLGSSYGFFLASAHVAASALSSENAVFALSLTTKYLNKLAAVAKQTDNEGTVAPNAFSRRYCSGR